MDDSDELPSPSLDSTEHCLKSSLANHISAVGVSAAVSTLLDNDEIRDEIFKVIFTASHTSLKSSLKANKSKLTASKKDRNYLLSLSPKNLVS